MTTVHFQHEFLNHVFESGKLLPDPIAPNKVRLYEGSLDKCSNCNEKSVYFYMDWTLSTKRFMCPTCIDTLLNNRLSVINHIDTLFKEKVNEEGYGDEDDEPETKDNDNARSSLETEWFTIMIGPENNIYLMSHNELFGSTLENDDELEDLSDEFEYKYKDMWFRLHDDFQLI